MKLKLAGWILISLLAIVVFSVIWYFFFTPKPVSTALIPESTPTLPVGEPVTLIPTPTSSPTQQRMTVILQDGDTMITNDFLQNGVTTPDPSNIGTYYLTGSSTDGYVIAYREQYFTIALEKEPLGVARLLAENFLLAALGVSRGQLCKLKYYVGTDVYTNSFYAAKNLGFSFCPGATVLPQ